MIDMIAKKGSFKKYVTDRGWGGGVGGYWSFL